MKIIVDKMPECYSECIFGKYDYRGTTCILKKYDDTMCCLEECDYLQSFEDLIKDNITK